ncbi:ribonuclease P protein component, partial [Bacillus cereus]|uniref:ribonuclease P protein component n=1 Tax=Bacillus cereus TaxID=1396 RepID=UPI00284E2996
RMVRQAMKEVKDEIDYGKDFVKIARKPCAEMTYEEVKKSLIHVFKRSGMKRIKK